MQAPRHMTPLYLTKFSSDAILSVCFAGGPPPSIVDLGYAKQEKALLERMSIAAQTIQVTVPEHMSPATVNEYSSEDVAGIASSFADAEMRSGPIPPMLSLSAALIGVNP